MPKGAPTKLTPELQEQIVSLVRAGNYIETAAAACGVWKQQLYKWLRRGNKCKSGLYKDFADAIKKAVAESEAHDIQIIKDAAKTQWQAAAWHAERKSHRKWGRKDKTEVEHSGKPGKPIQVQQSIIQVSQLSVELQQRIMEEIEGIASDVPRLEHDGDSGEQVPGPVQ